MKKTPKKKAPAAKPAAAPKPARSRAKKKAKADVNVETGGEFERLCPVPIDFNEIKNKHDRVIEALGEVHDKKAELASISKERRDIIKDIEGEIEVLRKQIGEGTEDRLVRCVTEKAFRDNKVRVRRIDTREIVEEREMTIDDRQDTLPGTTKSEPAPASEPDDESKQAADSVVDYD